MNKKFIILLVLVLSCMFFTSCKNSSSLQGITVNNSLQTNSENTSTQFQKLVDESDCCVIVSVNPKEKDEFDSKEINGEYYTDVKVESFSEYPEVFDIFPERITVIQKGSAFLEEANQANRTRFYYLFLNKTEDENTYYLTYNKSGAIETDFNYLYPLDKGLTEDLNEKFTHKRHKPDLLFRVWITSEYEFSEVMYETFESSIKDVTTENTATNLYTTPDIS